MKPLEEYMYFTKVADEITVINSQGVRSAQCHAHFATHAKSIDEPLQNISLGSDKAWVEDMPHRIPYKSVYIDSSEEEEQTQVVFIILISLFIIIIICCAIEVYRTDRAHKKRIERETDEGIYRTKQQAQEQFRKLSYKSVS